jgi:excisionase family DNA binding protein
MMEMKPMIQVMEIDEFIRTRFFAVDEVANFLGIHEESVRRLARQGSIKPQKVGKKLFFNIEEIKRFGATYDPRPGNKSKKTAVSH